VPKAPEPANAMTVFSTDDIPIRDRLPLWGEAVWRMIGGLDSRAFGDEAFQGRIDGGSASYVHICKLEATRHSVVRTPQHARRADREILKVVAQLEGVGQFEQFGRSVRLRPGDWSVYDTSHSYNVINPANVEQLVLMIPKERLPEKIAVEDLLVRRLSSGQGVSRLAWMSMLTAFRELPFMSATAAAGTADVLAQLVFLSLLDLRGESSSVGRRATLRDRIKALVASRLRDPELSVDTIANALNCSRRHLYNAFADEGDGVAEYILVERLAAARADLVDPRQSQRSVTDIAFDVGFNQPAHFSKVFATRYGCSPREWRRRARLERGL
jgi:AraC-like DNA-binding protein